ncbi:MAG: DUF2177 family protein [Gammaproteobacteria bacterium]|nr:DUF2177 family protein [Gammaproteobacteria bacterium]
MKPFIIAYLSVATAFLILDGLWLGLVARNFYASQLGELLRNGFLAVPAILFYLIYSAGLVWFAVNPGNPQQTIMMAGINGALVGFLAYGTYNLTNLSTLKNWPLTMTLVDWTWGTVMSGLIAMIAALVVRTFNS